MIEVPFQAFILFFVYVLLATVAGVILSRLLPWSDDAHQTGLPWTVGISLGPFLFGMASVLALGIFRGAAHLTHLAFVLLFLAGTAAAACLPVRAREKWERPNWGRVTTAVWPLVVSILYSVLALIFISLFVPLTQNDALEYALAARELYATRDLLTYPVLNSETNLTGFFGPWTHPPLYVAMLYMAEVIQGHADTPSLIRLISPWFMLCGAMVAFALGSFVNRAVGFLACLLFLSPPLFFLGAGSALLDPLPVLGFTLILTAIIGLKTRPVVFGAVIGALLGLALWTHSQAILFVPLAIAAIVIERGLKDFRGLISGIGALLLFAIVIGGWPYWRNIWVFGAPVTDNPAVFAMPELHWDDYFSINRGLDNTTAMIQYGILKGWFALESYGFIFWGMTVGMVFFLARQKLSAVRKLVIEGARGFERREAALWLMGALLVVYIVGVILSVILGIEHMVKNERYLLVTLPMVSVLCAYGYEQLVGCILPRLRIVGFALYAMLALVLCLQISVFVYYRTAKHGISFDTIAAPMEEKLYFAPEYSLIRQMNGGLDEDSLVLSMKPADMYYAEGRMLSYLDPRLLPFYGETETEAAYQHLLDLGVTHIHVPDYGLPPLYNSQLYVILRDPSFSTLASQTVSGQIYSLVPQALSEGERIDLSPAERQWTFETSLFLGGRKGFAKTVQGSTVFEGSAYRGGLPLDLFHRHWASGLKTGVGEDGLATEDHALRVAPSAQYRLDLELGGTGSVKLTIDQFAPEAGDATMRLISRMQIASFELSADQSEREYGVRFVTEPTASYIAVSIESVGTSTVRIDGVSYVLLTGE